jgi:hypothetical protein
VRSDGRTHLTLATARSERPSDWPRCGLVARGFGGFADRHQFNRRSARFGNRFLLPLLVSLALLFLSLAGVASAGVNVWTTNGPVKSDGTTSIIRVLAIDPSAPATLYAGASDGVFKSADGGWSWAPTNAGLTSTDIHALAIDPANPATLYAGTCGGVFKSTDSGGTWVAVTRGLTNLYVQALAIDPSASTTLYAGILGGGVFKSTDSGDTWVTVNGGGFFPALRHADPVILAASILARARPSREPGLRSAGGLRW